MLKEKLQKVKQHSKSYQVTPKTILRFKTDTDPETLLSIIPKTQYTTSKYKNFNRQVLTTSQERIFNTDFTKYMKDLFIHKDEDWFEYLLDFFIQQFAVENYNVDELVFLILTNKKYDEQIKFMSAKVSWMKDYVWSYTYFASMLLKEAFFDFFMDYFEYYEHAKEFIENVLCEYVKIGNYDKTIDRMYFLLETLHECDEELYKKVCEKLQDHIEIDTTVFHNKKRDTTEITKRIKIDDEHIDLFKKEILNDYNLINSKNIEKVIKLFKKLDKREGLAQYLIKNHKEYVLEHLNVGEITYHQSSILVTDLHLILKNMPIEKLSAFNKSFLQQNIKAIIELLIKMPNIDFAPLVEFINIADVLHYNLSDKIIFENISQIAQHMNYNLTDHIISHKFYNDYTIHYLIYNCHNTDTVWTLLEKQNNLYLFSCFINHIDIENLKGSFIKIIIPAYITRNICIDIIAEIIKLYHNKYMFVQQYLKNIVKSDKQGNHITLHKVYYERNTQYINDLLVDNNLQVLSALCLHTNILINIDNDCFVTNYKKLMQILFAAQTKNNYCIESNVLTFTKLYLENHNDCAGIEEVACQNITFYTALIRNFDHPYAKSYILNSIYEMKQHYNLIVEIISANVDLFINTYYQIFDCIKDSVLLDFSNIVKFIKPLSEDAKYNITNLNAFIMFSLSKEYNILSYLNNIFDYCDELSIFTLLHKYGNLMIPYLDSIIVSHLGSHRIQKELFKINALEVIKVLTRYIEKENIKEYFKLYLQKIDKVESNMVISFIIKGIDKFSDKDLMTSFIVFCANNNASKQTVYDLLNNFEENDVYDILLEAIQYKPSYFDPYITNCVEKMMHLDCVTEYFKYSKKKDENIDLCEQLYTTFIKDIYNTRNIYCFASVLNFINDKEKNLEVNNRLLKDIKDNEKIESFDILGMLYEHVTEFKQCIASSVTYFGLFFDHRNKMIEENTKKLLEDIVDFTGENPYEYF